MSRASLRWWLSLWLVGLAFVLGVSVGVWVTPTVEFVTIVDYCPPRDAVERAGSLGAAPR